MITIYVYSKCSTCQKALKFLDERKIPYIRKEITIEPPSVQNLKKMLAFSKGNLKALFNTSGQLYREMELSKKLESLSVDEALHLLSLHGMLVKRPFLIGDSIGLTGFNENKWSKIH